MENKGPKPSYQSLSMSLGKPQRQTGVGKPLMDKRSVVTQKGNLINMAMANRCLLSELSDGGCGFL